MMTIKFMWVLVLFLGYPSEYNPKEEASVALRAFYTEGACKYAQLAMWRGTNPGSWNEDLQCIYEGVMTETR
jgi:hypothetical protein